MGVRCGVIRSSKGIMTSLYQHVTYVSVVSGQLKRNISEKMSYLYLVSYEILSQIWTTKLIMFRN